MIGNRKPLNALLSLLLLCQARAVRSSPAFLSAPTAKTSPTAQNVHGTSMKLQVEGNEISSRRGSLRAMSYASLGLGGILLPQNAFASGGATAGGAYLLSAKQRYNQRVTAGIKSFLLLSSSLEAGNLDEAKAFFVSEEEGGWKDGSSAGYLLSNAFRRNSTTPPDSLPSVKKWKAFASEVEAVQKAIKKKSASSALASYRKAEAALDDYLDAVELPPVIEMRQE